MRWLLALGVLGGVAWFGYATVVPGCNPPSGETEVFCNRLGTSALAAMAAALLGLRLWAGAGGRRGAKRGLAVVALGYGLMAFGNGAEYWVFSSWPHEGPDGWLRGILWMTALAGWLLILVGSMATGLLLLLRRSTSAMTGFGIVLVVTTSLTVTLGALALGLVAGVASGYALVTGIRANSEAATSPA